MFIVSMIKNTQFVFQNKCSELTSKRNLIILGSVVITCLVIIGIWAFWDKAPVEKDKTAVEEIISEDKKDKTAVEEIISEDKKDKTAVDEIISKDNKDKTAVEEIISEDNKNKQKIDEDNKENKGIISKSTKWVKSWFSNKKSTEKIPN